MPVLAAIATLFFCYSGLSLFRYGKEPTIKEYVRHTVHDANNKRHKHASYTPLTLPTNREV
eukprot:NODE_25014_length_602_cov_4.018947.p4 GENE.NODE_25014_length_602_cov_4.018947~~NODE_25014_length_602_cov_4.018947.p4  ORF type:complete len:61 (-),score=2.13 NODE_25014_length_602_cov_4.018947:133-315(-)